MPPSRAIQVNRAAALTDHRPQHMMIEPAERRGRLPIPRQRHWMQDRGAAWLAQRITCGEQSAF